MPFFMQKNVSCFVLLVYEYISHLNIVSVQQFSFYPLNILLHMFCI